MKTVPVSVYRRGVPKSASKPTRFRLYAETGSRLYIMVQVWPTRKAMIAYMADRYPGNGSYRWTHGMCSAFDVIAFPKGRPQRKREIFAEINLYAKGLSMRIVVHEMFHASVAWARRRGLDMSRLGNDESEDSRSLVTDVEERVATVHSDLCNDFMRRSLSLRLYREDSQPVQVA